MDSQELAELLHGLRRHAAWLLSGERAGHSLQPTALLHEAYLRIKDDLKLDTASPMSVRIALIREMRRVLVDHARRRGAVKRGGKGLIAVSLDDEVVVDHPSIVGVILIESALSKMAAEDARAADLVVLRIYGGLTEKELAAHFRLSRAWVQGKWAWARDWLRQELLDD